jgi:hypothetical protein
VKRVIAVVLSSAFAHAAMAQPSELQKALDTWVEPAGSPDPAIGIWDLTKLSAIRTVFGAGRYQTVNKARLEGAVEKMLKILSSP